METKTPCYRKDASMVSRKIANEVILVPIRQNIADMEYIFNLDGVACRIWELLDEHSTVDQIVAALTLEYAVEAERAKADVTELLAQMKEIGAVTDG